MTYFCLSCGDEKAPEKRMLFFITKKCRACGSERLIWSNEEFYEYWKAIYELKCLIHRSIENLQKVIQKSKESREKLEGTREPRLGVVDENRVA